MEQLLKDTKIEHWFNPFRQCGIDHGYSVHMRHLLPRPMNTEKLRRAMLDELFED